MKARIVLMLLLLIGSALIGLVPSIAQTVPDVSTATGDGYWECPIAPESLVSCSFANVEAAALVDGQNGWAVGDGGLLLRYRLGQWGQVGDLPAGNLYGLALKDVDNGWAVGVSSDNRGGILRLKDGQWSALAPVTPSALFGIALSGSNAWAVGANGVTLFYDGVDWLGLASPSQPGFACDRVDLAHHGLGRGQGRRHLAAEWHLERRDQSHDPQSLRHRAHQRH